MSFDIYCEYLSEKESVMISRDSLLPSDPGSGSLAGWSHYLTSSNVCKMFYTIDTNRRSEALLINRLNNSG